VGHSSFVALLVLAAFASAGCHRRQPSPEEQVVAPAPRATDVEPVDRTLPGELAEGTERAFGLLLPRAMVVSGRFDDVVFASGRAAPDQVANYVRRRINADKVETGPSKTLFTRATVKGHPGPLVSVEVVARDGTTDMQVREVTPKAAKEGLTDEERWREVGLKPDGTPLDPTHLGAEPR
jgi:hypothetical protein